MNVVFDIGGSWIRCAVVSGGGIVRKKKRATPKVFAEGVAICGELARSILDGEGADRVVAGVAGTLDATKRNIYRIPQLPLWNGGCIASELEKILGCPVFVENDAALGGLGEAVYGAGRKQNIVAYLTVGTSVGGARIVSGKIDANAHGFEPGHQIFSFGGESRRLFEWVSGRAVEIKTGKIPTEISDENFWREMSICFSPGVANAVVFWSPNVIVMGGSVGNMLSISVIEEEIRKHLGIFPDIPHVILAELGDDSGLWGGVALLGSM